MTKDYNRYEKFNSLSSLSFLRVLVVNSKHKFYGHTYDTF